MSRPVVVLLCSLLALSACSAADDGEAGAVRDVGASGSPSSTADDGRSDGASDADAAGLADQQQGTVLVPGDDAIGLATATSAALFDSAPLVVLAGAEDLVAQAPAASAAVHLGVPLLLTRSPASADDPVVGEIARLGSEAVLAVGAAATSWTEVLDDVDVVTAPSDFSELAELTGMRTGGQVVVEPGQLAATVAGLDRDRGVPVLAVQPDGAAPPAVEGDGELPETAAPRPLDGVVALASIGSNEPLAAVATARAAGVEVLSMGASDPRADPAVIATLADREPTTVLALGDTFGTQEKAAGRVATAMTGVQLPGGGQLILPGKRYVALYGHPGSDALGVLGEQGPDASVARAQRLAAEYAAAGSVEPVVPTFEVITTVASSAAGPDGDYSSESTLDHVRPYVDAAARSGTYVVLDLQPGYTDFLTQAKRYEELLAQPHVGLALDPEWRLRPGERHMRQIGRVSAAEVNSVVDWLADLTRERKLPQKLLLLHQFKTFMLENREQIDASRDELAVITQMDGHGPPSTKMETWNVIRPGAPAGMTFGWKNFYDEDKPTLSPAQTLAVQPTPVFISYQ